MEILSYFLQHGKFQKLESKEYSDLLLLSSLLLVFKMLIMKTKLDFRKRNQKMKQPTRIQKLKFS